MSALAAFHFLRPGWLLLLIPAVLLLWALWRGQSDERGWRRVLAPHLLQHLLIHDQGVRHRWTPLLATALLWLLGTLALAGPTWQRAPSPFQEDRSALVIALKVTPSMLAKDVQPSRLERAVHKIRDLLALRDGGRTALIAYAGSAHLVMPLTSDARIIASFAAELTPEIMPRDGDAASEAVALANARLKDAALPGSILLIADDIAPKELDALARARESGGAKVQILAMAAAAEVQVPADSPPAPALDLNAMRKAADAAGADLVLPSVDGADVAQINRQLVRDAVTASVDDQSAWQDAGYLLVPPLVLIVLLGFRRGWELRT